jgi:hypothetical protein
MDSEEGRAGMKTGNETKTDRERSHELIRDFLDWCDLERGLHLHRDRVELITWVTIDETIQEYLDATESKCKS